MVLVETCVPFSVQFTNWYPVAGMAVTVAEDPELNVPPPLVLPPDVGFDERVTILLMV